LNDHLQVDQSAATRAAVWEWLNDPAHAETGFLALVNDSVVGLAHFRPYDDTLAATPTTTATSSAGSATVVFLDDLFVDRAARGQGVGRALIEAVRGYAAAQGWRGPLRWNTYPDNAAARALYDSICGGPTPTLTYEVAAATPTPPHRARLVLPELASPGAAAGAAVSPASPIAKGRASPLTSPASPLAAAAAESPSSPSGVASPSSLAASLASLALLTAASSESVAHPSMGLPVGREAEEGGGARWPRDLGEGEARLLASGRFVRLELMGPEHLEGLWEAAGSGDGSEAGSFTYLFEDSPATKDEVCGSDGKRRRARASGGKPVTSTCNGWWGEKLCARVHWFVFF